MANKPFYSVALQHFNDIYGNGSPEHVANKIKGKVKINIDRGRRGERGGFTDLCTIRMSYVLNKCGITISASDGATSGGGDGQRYLYRVADLRPFLIRKFGQPDVTDSSSSHSAFIGRKGIMLFEVPFRGATGHATLWRGNSEYDCADSCYFPLATTVYLWELP